MRIAFIGQKGIPAVSGGVEKHVEKLAVRLASLGHDVTVYARAHYSDPNVTEWHGVRLVFVPSINTKHLDAITHAFFATLHSLTQGYDVIHYQSIGPSVFSVLPRIFSRADVVATFHCQDYFHKKWGVFARACLRFGEWMTCTFPEKTITVSRGLAEYAEKKYDRNAVYIPNGAEVEKAETPELLSQWDLKPGRYVLSVSRLVEHKGIHYLIKAFKEIEDTGKLPNNYKLVIVGTHANTADYERYLRFLGEKRSNILFLGERSGRELSTLFTYAGLFVQPSEDEGMSLALLEAMAYGLPIVSSDIPANQEVLGDTGRIFESKNVEALKREMAEMINNEGIARESGARAVKRVRDCFSWDAIARRTDAVYRTLASVRNNK